MKLGMQELANVHAQPLILGALQSPAQPIVWIGGGLLSYGLSLLVWLTVLVRYPLSFAYPLLSVSYVLVYFGATQWPRLMESATPLRTAGTLLIMAGVTLVSLTANGKRDDA